MRSRWNWSRPEPRIYSYNTDPSTFNIGYSSSSSSRSMRASSVAAGAESQSVRSARATTVAPASDNSLSGYSGFFGRQLAQHGNQSSTTSSMKASTISSKAVTETKSVEKTERSSRKVDMMTEHNQSLEYGKQSRSAALRRAELHAVKSGKDPRHVMVPWNLEDDVCKKVSVSIIVASLRDISLNNFLEFLGSTLHNVKVFKCGEMFVQKKAVFI